MKKNLDEADTFGQSLGLSLTRGSTVVYIFFNKASPCVTVNGLNHAPTRNASTPVQKV